MKITDKRKKESMPCIGSLTPGTWVDLNSRAMYEKMELRIGVILDTDDELTRKALITNTECVAVLTLAGEIIAVKKEARFPVVDIEVIINKEDRS